MSLVTTFDDIYAQFWDKEMPPIYWLKDTAVPRAIYSNRMVKFGPTLLE